MSASGGREKKKREYAEVMKATENALQILSGLSTSAGDSDA